MGENAEKSLELINDDCMNVMSRYSDNHFDLAIVDPPYGSNDAIGLKDCINKSKQATKRTDYKQFENIEPSKEYFDELKRVSKSQIIWGVNFYKNVILNGGRIVWDKKGTAFGRAELAYCSKIKSVNIFEFQWNGMLQGNMKNKEKRIHPTQKPVALYKWLLENYAKDGDIILDTHAGSFSSAVACKEKGFSGVFVELDKDYFEAGKQRVEKAKRQYELIDTFKKEKQNEMPELF